LNDKKHEGILLYRNGDTYEGAFIDDMKSGEGLYTFKRGALKSFDGIWHCDDYHTGVMLHTNGDNYNGQFQNGKYDGQGVYSYSDGMSCSGKWVAGERSGAGQITFYNGDLFTDVFLHDKAVSGGDSRYINVTIGAVTTGEAALQLARDHGAEQFAQRARKWTCRYEHPVGSSGKGNRRSVRLLVLLLLQLLLWQSLMSVITMAITMMMLMMMMTTTVWLMMIAL
jgi:hypothetical protein